MKQTNVICCMAAFALTMAATGCSNEKDLFDPDSIEQSKKVEYKEAFVQQFGNIAPGHDWGFKTVWNATGTPSSRANFPNANEWGDYATVPAPLTDEQIAVVTKWFEEHQNPTGTSVNWTDYFAQQVNSTEYGSRMQFLTTSKEGGDEFHVYNANSGDISQCGNVWSGELRNPNDPNDKVTYSDRISFMRNSRTDLFGYYNTPDSKTYYRYVIIPGDIIDPIVAGRHFVGFDYEEHLNNEIPADGYFDDWIICITPGIYHANPEKNDYGVRIIAEDLGKIGDFDFNDVVFDVMDIKQDDVEEFIITIQAAGGTLPLTVAGVEVHEALGVDTDVMVNTGAGTNRPVAIFRVSKSEYPDPESIPVVVTMADGSQITLSSKAGEAPAKICVPLTYKWAKERTNIKTAYPRFEEYVSNPTLTDWCTNPVPGTVVE